MSFVTYDRPAKRVWVGHQRVHHGPVGLVFLAFGIYLILDDWHDLRSWFRLGDQTGEIFE